MRHVLAASALSLSLMVIGCGKNNPAPGSDVPSSSCFFMQNGAELNAAETKLQSFGFKFTNAANLQHLNGAQAKAAGIKQNDQLTALDNFTAVVDKANRCTGSQTKADGEATSAWRNKALSAKRTSLLIGGEIADATLKPSLTALENTGVRQKSSAQPLFLFDTEHAAANERAGAEAKRAQAAKAFLAVKAQKGAHPSITHHLLNANKPLEKALKGILAKTPNSITNLDLSLCNLDSQTEHLGELLKELDKYKKNGPIPKDRLDGIQKKIDELKKHSPTP